MEYFELVQDEKVENPIVIRGLDRMIYNNRMTEMKFQSLKYLKVAYYNGTDAEESCGILMDPLLLISDRMKRLFEVYSKGFCCKAIQLYPLEVEHAPSPLYWIPWIPDSGCLHPTSKRYGNGKIQNLVLDGSRTGEKDILCIADNFGRKIVVSLALAESLLWRGIYGIGLKKLEVFE